MNKTIIINMNGVVFHIEEEAYEILKSYMTSVKYHFAYSRDSNEIVTDIENRLAEMFTERLSEHSKQVITLQDVEEITSKMGKPSDFDLDENDEEYASLKPEKTLYKDTDNRILGGVCAGLAHYLGMEAKWVRIITAVLTLASGLGLLLYVVLWIILPAAKTRQEKLAMRGEPINLQSFKKSLDEESDTFINPANTEREDPVRDILIFTGRILKVVVKAIGVFVIGMGVIALLALLAGLLFGLGFINSTDFNQFPFNVINPEYQSSIFLSAFLIIIIPLLALILFAIRVLFNKKVISRYGTFAMLILWLTGLVTGVYYGSKIAAEFYEEARFEQTTELKPFSTVNLILNSSTFFTKEDSLKYNISNGNIQGRIIYGGNEMGREVRGFRLHIEKSDDNRLVLIKELSARGNTFESALKSAQRIRYQVNQADSLLYFDKYLSLAGDGLFRAQALKLYLKVPLNTRLVIDGKLGRYLRNQDLWYCQPEEGDHHAPSEWIVTEDGLKCADQQLYERKKNR